MARVRSLKPTFFTDYDLAQLPPLHRLAFQGLWCHADRNGLLEDRPPELKVKILPYDQCDFEKILRDLSEPKNGGPGFIRRYQAGTRRVIAVSKWNHQKPHPKELASDLPPPGPWPDIVEPGKNTAEQDPAVKINGQSGGSLVLGSGSLVLGDGSHATTTDSNRAMSSLSIASVDAGARKDRREENSPGAPLRGKAKPVQEFFLWAQLAREEAVGRMAEDQLGPVEDDEWWASAMSRCGGRVELLRQGYLNYLGEKFYREKSCKWAMWRKHWAEFLPEKDTAPTPRRQPCAACGEADDGSGEVWGHRLCVACRKAWEASPFVDSHGPGWLDNFKQWRAEAA